MMNPDRDSLIHLAKELARHYQSIEDYRVILADAGMAQESIHFDARAFFSWLYIFKACQQQGAFVALFERVLEDYGDDVFGQALSLNWAYDRLGPMIDNLIKREELAWQNVLDKLFAKETLAVDDMSPSALLVAKYEVVPFIFRQEELASLMAWCERPNPLALRLYHGVGGLGKTRLLLELMNQLSSKDWLKGFVKLAEAKTLLEDWDLLLSLDKPMLLVIDYAENQLEALEGFLESAYKQKHLKQLHHLRIVLLARNAGEWWEKLCEASKEQSSWLLASEVIELSAVADSLEQRQRLFQAAVFNFAKHLDQPPPQELHPDLSAKHFERALLILMDALLALDPYRQRSERDMESLLADVLSFERGYWRKQLKGKGIKDVETKALLDGLQAALALCALGRELKDVDEAVDCLKEDRNFEGKSYAELKSLVEVLNAAYREPERYIGTIQPDLLAEYLVFKVWQQAPKPLLARAFIEERARATQHRSAAFESFVPVAARR
ncbi:MAG: hypothetical protein R2880_15905 [Deinococcales bacterium]